MAALRRATEWLTVLVGIGFVFGGGAKLADPERAVALFASWGVRGEWTIVTAGWVEIGLGLALLNRPTRALGAAGLGLWMFLWGALQLAAGSWAAAASGGVLVLMGLNLVTARAARRHPGASGPRGVLLRDGPWIESPLDDRPTGIAEAAGRLTRIVGLAFLIRWAVGGIPYWLGLPLVADLSVRSDARAPRNRLERTLLHLLVLGLGVSGMWAFVGHTFMSGAVSQSVGWAPSPFQRELAFYHLAIGLSGIACWWIRDHFWLAAAAIPSIFLYGAGWVHLADFVEHGNAAPANWGFSVLFGNLVLPTALLLLVTLRIRWAAGDPASLRR